jgi:hypothetical protein
VAVIVAAGATLLTGNAAAAAATVDLGLDPVSITVSTDPVAVDVGGSPHPAAGDAAPPSSRPPVGATVRLGADASVAVGSPEAGPVADGTVPAVPPVAAPVPLRRTGPLVAADVSLDVCVAVAILTGAGPEGCGAPAKTSATTSRTGALVDALARIGLCVRLAIGGGTPVGTCGAPLGQLDQDVVDESLIDDADGAGAGRLCLAAEQLGLGVGPCSGVDADSATSVAGASTGTGAGVAGASDLCLGLAVLTSGDVSRCSAAVDPGSDGGVVPSGDDDDYPLLSGLGDAAASVPFASLADTADRFGLDGLAASLPTTGAPATVALLGLALGAIGLGVRRLAALRTP